MRKMQFENSDTHHDCGIQRLLCYDTLDLLIISSYVVLNTIFELRIVYEFYLGGMPASSSVNKRPSQSNTTGRHVENKHTIRIYLCIQRPIYYMTRPQIWYCTGTGWCVWQWVDVHRHSIIQVTVYDNTVKTTPTYVYVLRLTCRRIETNLIIKRLVNDATVVLLTIMYK